MNKNLIRGISIAGLLLGGISALIGNWVNEKNMESMIEEKVIEINSKKEES